MSKWVNSVVFVIYSVALVLAALLSWEHVKATFILIGVLDFMSLGFKTACEAYWNRTKQ